MGIHGLTKLLSDECPGCIKEQELKNLTGRKVAIDASMVMYQFLVAVRSDNSGYASAMLMNEAGEITSHIQGMFNRTIKLLSAGVKPVFVFDGKPPDLKSGELAKRTARRQQAEADLAAAKESGEQEDIDRYSRRLVKVTKQHNDDCKELLRLMGVPVVTAPCEAEAQCAELAKSGRVFATATEDMDALTFRTPKLLRKLTMSQATSGPNKQQPILEIDLEVALSGLQLTFEQFVDLCILCGCDYCDSIKGIGPKTALKLIKQFKNIEGVVRYIQREKKKKYNLPRDWVKYKVKKDVGEQMDESTVDGQNKEVSICTLQDEGGGEGIAVCQDGGAGAGDNVTAEKTGEEGESGVCGVIPDDDTKPAVPAVCVDLDNGEEGEGGEEGDEGEDLDLFEEDYTGGDVEEKEEEEEAGDGYEWVQPSYIRARALFLEHEVLPASDVELKWVPPLEEELRAYLVERMGFNAERVDNGIKKLVEAQGKKAQQRMDRCVCVSRCNLSLTYVCVSINIYAAFSNLRLLPPPLLLLLLAKERLLVKPLRGEVPRLPVVGLGREGGDTI